MKSLIIFLSIALCSLKVSAQDSLSKESPSLYEVIYGEWVLTSKYNLEKEKSEKVNPDYSMIMIFEKARKNWFNYLYANNGVFVGQKLVTSRDNFFSGLKGYNNCEFISNTANTITVKARSTSSGNLYNLTFTKQ
jgi:hypothetical protein